MKNLISLSLVLPNNLELCTDLHSMLGNFGIDTRSGIEFFLSNPEFIPKIRLMFEDIDTPKVVFISDDRYEILIENNTGLTRESPYEYTPISMHEFTSRLDGRSIVELDHIGFNLPWFEGVHPDILSLREQLASKCAYFRFPTGEEWDFILPASQDEIGSSILDLSIARKPKIEIVSFNKASRPLVQFDVSVDYSYAELTRLFPEGISDPELKNIWVYIKTPWNIDICFVVNEPRKNDWSSFFEGHRLVSGS